MNDLSNFDDFWETLDKAECPEDLFGTDLAPTPLTSQTLVKERQEMMKKFLGEHLEDVSKRLEGVTLDLNDYLEKIQCYGTWAREKLMNDYKNEKGKPTYGDRCKYRLQLDFKVGDNGGRVFVYHENDFGRTKADLVRYHIELRSLSAHVFGGQLAFHRHIWNIRRGGQDLCGGSVSAGYNRHQDGLPWFMRDYESKGHVALDILSPTEFEYGDILELQTTAHGSIKEFFFLAIPGRGNCYASVAERTQHIKVDFDHVR